MSLPNFFIIGAMKSGTTALYNSLSLHPEIFMCPVKEPHYFTFQGEPPLFDGPGGGYFLKTSIWRPKEYFMLFSGASREKAIGEASASYLYSNYAALRIKENIPNAKIIAILRHPAERAYSQYNYFRFHGVEPAPTFMEALASEEIRKRDNWSPFLMHRDAGFYHRQLLPYFELFGRQQIKIILYEEWNASPLSVLRELFAFLEVDENFVPEVPRSNVTYQTPNDRTPPHPLDPAIRQKLTEEYRGDILKLQTLIDRDLSHWLT